MSTSTNNKPVTMFSLTEGDIIVSVERRGSAYWVTFPEGEVGPWADIADVGHEANTIFQNLCKGN